MILNFPHSFGSLYKCFLCFNGGVFHHVRCVNIQHICAVDLSQTCFHEEKSGVFPIMHCVLWREEKHVQLLYDLILMLHTQMDIYERKIERRRTVISL